MQFKLRGFNLQKISPPIPPVLRAHRLRVRRSNEGQARVHSLMSSHTIKTYIYTFCKSHSGSVQSRCTQVRMWMRHPRLSPGLRTMHNFFDTHSPRCKENEDIIFGENWACSKPLEGVGNTNLDLCEICLAVTMASISANFKKPESPSLIMNRRMIRMI
jgi:hypothetical protein